VVVLLGLLVPVIALLAGGRGEKPAVLREETPVYRIPDPQGTLEARLPEGRRVLIRSTAGSWVYLESPDGAAGWAPRAAAAVY
jgi:hypothetical protein